MWIGDQRYDARICATDRPEELGVQDVVFVALKSSTLPQAAPAIAPLLGPATGVVFAMNGIPWWYLYRCPENGLPRPDLSRLDPGGVLARTIGLERVIGCMVASANTVVEPGVIRNSGGTRNRFTLGEPDGTRVAPGPGDLGRVRTRRAQRPGQPRDPQGDLGEIAAQSRREPDLRDDGRADQRDFAASRTVRIVQGADGRGPRDGARDGIDPGITVETAYPRAPTMPHKSSMLQDFEAGRPPEIDGILTAVQAFARAAAVPTPHVDAITALVIEKGRRMGLSPAANS